MRYFNASSQPYITDFVPQNMDLIYKMQQNLIEEDSKALSDLEASKKAFNIKGGFSTSKEAAALNQMYNTEANKISQELASGAISSRDASRKIGMLLNHFTTNPEVNLVTTDAAYVPQVKQMLKENPGFLENGLAQGWDNKNKTWKSINSNYSLEDFEKHYEGITPKTYTEDFADWYKLIEPDLNKYLEKEQWNVVPNPDGSTTSYSTITNMSKEEITRNKVRELAEKYVAANPGVYNRQAVRYDVLNESNNYPDSKFGDADIVNKLVDSFPGYFEKNIESQKSGKSYTSKAPVNTSEVPLSQLDNGVFDNIDNSQDLSGFYNSLDKNGNLSKTKGNIVKPKGGLPMTAFPLFDIETGENTDYEKQINFINNIRKQLPNLTKGLKTDKEVLDLYKNIVKQSGQISHNAFTLEGLDTEAITKNVMSNLSGRKIRLTGDNESTTLEAVAKKLGWTKEELRDKIKDSQVNGIKPISNNNPGSFKVTVYDSQNMPREITIAGSTDQQNYFKEFNELLENDNKGIVGEKITDNYFSVTRLNERENGAEYGTLIFRLSPNTITPTELKNKYGNLVNAEKQGVILRQDKRGNYRQVLTQQPINPTDLGRALTTEFNHNYGLGLKTFKHKRK